MLKAAESYPATAQWFAGQRIFREASDQASDGDLTFQPREAHAGAVMRATGKGEMPIRIAADVESFG